jgi:tetratricopeptide (TPR) repeat protein
VGDVVPAWAIALKSARRRREWSQLRLAHELRAVADEHRRKQLPGDESLVRRVSSWENGAHRPDELYQRLLVAVFPELAADLFGESVQPAEPDVLERLGRALRNPRLTDRRVADHLADVLAAQRRLEDVIGARRIIQPSLEQIAVIESLSQDAPHEVRKELLRIGGEWSQFVGWMHKDIGDSDGAGQWYDRAMEWAQRSGSADMIASALSLKSHLAWSMRDAARAVDLAEASLEVPGTSAAVRALSAQQRARGHAISAEPEETERWLDEAERLTHDAADNPEAQPPWVYFHSPARLSMQRAIAYTELGKGEEAAELLQRGLSEMNGSYLRDLGWHVARLAVAHVVAENIPDAAHAVVDAAGHAVATGSAQTFADVRRAVKQLRVGWPNHPAVQHMEEALRALTA